MRPAEGEDVTTVRTRITRQAQWQRPHIAEPYTTIGRLTMIHFRGDVSVAKRRETHVAPVALDGDLLLALCGDTFHAEDVELVAELGDVPCVQCQLLSPSPDWTALAQLPDGHAQRISRTGP